jgi:hypothetical protein
VTTPARRRTSPEYLDEALALSHAAADLAHAALDLATPDRGDNRLRIAEVTVLAASHLQNLATTLITDYHGGARPDPATRTAPLFDDEHPF